MPDAPSSRLASWEERTRWLIIAAAVLPFTDAVVPIDLSDSVLLTIDLASWLVFLVDLVVHVWLRRRYLRTGTGLFDLSIVLLTFPWYVLPGVDGTEFLAVFRLARLLRLVTATQAGRRLRYLYERTGSLLVVSVVTLLLSSLIVFNAEPAESGFDTFGDAVWWGVVTLTTVGYGDFFPTTGIGRLAGFVVMGLGLAVLGTLAGVLASMFGGGAESLESGGASLDERLEGLGRKLDEIERQVASLQELLERRQPPAGGAA